MERKKFAEFIRALKEANKRGEDVDAIMKAHEHENAYIYNDGVFKKIFASEENIALTTDLVNASLDLFGSDCISHPRIVNPFVPGETGNGSVEPDVMLVNDRGGGLPRPPHRPPRYRATPSFLRPRSLPPLPSASPFRRSVPSRATLRSACVINSSACYILSVFTVSPTVLQIFLDLRPTGG